MVQTLVLAQFSHYLSKEFGLKSYKPIGKPCLTSAIKKKRLSFANKHFYETLEKWEQFYSLTNLQFRSLQCKRGTFKDQMPKIQCEVLCQYSKTPPKSDSLGSHKQTWGCLVVSSCPGTTIKDLKNV